MRIDSGNATGGRSGACCLLLPLLLAHPNSTPSRHNTPPPTPTLHTPTNNNNDNTNSHLPHGFYERELLGFFSQFGRLTRVRVSRSKRTAKAKHYAFLEFAVPEVARIAAEAMDGHFMFAQRLSVRCLRRAEVHPELFKGANRKFKQVPWRKIEAERHNRDRTPREHAARVAALLRKDRKRAAAIAAAGIDYEYEGLAAALPGRATRIKFVD